MCRQQTGEKVAEKVERCATWKPRRISKRMKQGDDIRPRRRKVVTWKHSWSWGKKLSSRRRQENENEVLNKPPERKKEWSLNGKNMTAVDLQCAWVSFLRGFSKRCNVQRMTLFSELHLNMPHLWFGINHVLQLKIMDLKKSKKDIMRLQKIRKLIWPNRGNRNRLSPSSFV